MFIGGSQGFVGSVFEDAHRDMVCVGVFIGSEYACVVSVLVVLRNRKKKKTHFNNQPFGTKARLLIPLNWIGFCSFSYPFNTLT